MSQPSSVWIAHSPDDPVASVCHAFEQSLYDDAHVLNESPIFAALPGDAAERTIEGIYAADVVVALVTPTTDEPWLVGLLRQAQLYRKPILVLYWWARGGREPQLLATSVELRVLLSGWPHLYVRTSGLDDKLRRLLSELRSRDATERPTDDRYEIFVSKRSLDAGAARTVYDYLLENGRSVFLSDDSLLEQGSTDYSQEIDRAIDRATHLIVVGTSVENIESSWVQAEWRMFINEKRSERKSGNVVTVLDPDVSPSDLPIALRQFEVIPLTPESLPRLLSYV